jgi:Beta protein
MLPYHPALRFKKGEYVAGARLAHDMGRYMEPRFIIPPPIEADPEKGRPLTADEIAYLTGERIGKHWPFGRAFLDAQFVAPALGDEGLKKLFRTAQGTNNKLVSVATVGDLFNPTYRAFMRDSKPRIGVYLPYEDVDTKSLLEGLKALNCAPEDCLLFLDFTGAPFEIDGIAGSVAGLFDRLGTAARWYRIVFQGSAYPTTNPADRGGKFLVPRHEWQTFHEALKECSISPTLIGFGDYGADCGEINFPRKSGGGRAIRHLRYTGTKHTVVVRGAEQGTDAVIMRDVCQRVLDSGHFAGQGFSYADDLIWRGAKGLDGPGNASTWREWNMAHHMTRVVRDLGAMAGVTFADGPASKIIEQSNLFANIDQE